MLKMDLWMLPNSSLKINSNNEFTGKNNPERRESKHIYKLVDTQDPSILDYHSKIPSTPKPSESNKSETPTVVTTATENKSKQKSCN